MGFGILRREGLGAAGAAGGQTKGCAHVNAGGCPTVLTTLDLYCKLAPFLDAYLEQSMRSHVLARLFPMRDAAKQINNCLVACTWSIAAVRVQSDGGFQQLQGHR